MRRIVLSGLASFIVLVGFSTVFAQTGVPEKMLIRGALPETMEGISLPTDTNANLTLGIYDTDGTLLWSENQDVTLGKNRDYGAVLGEQVNLSPDIFQSGSELWLGVTVHLPQEDGSARAVEILPRQPLLPIAAYAFKAQYAEQLTGSGGTETSVESPPASSNKVAAVAGDITAVRTPATSGLQGGAESGAVSLSVKPLGITSARLANGAVTNAKIAVGAVGSGKMADNAVTTPKIVDAAVTNPKIANGAVTGPKIASEAVGPGKISSAGSTAGQVLTSTGSSVEWTGVPILPLPYNRTTATTGFGFSVTNTNQHAIRGLATNTGSVINYGGYFEAYGASGRAVAGAVSGTKGLGVYGSANSGNSDSAGLYGTNVGFGVKGYSTGGTNGWSGVYGETNSTFLSDAGVKGVSTAGATGVYGSSTSGPGVYGQTSSNNNHAGYFYTSSGLGLNGSAVFAENTNTGSGIALWAKTSGTDATAVFSNNGTGYLIKGFGGDGGEHEFAVYNNGQVWTEGGVQVVGSGRVITPVLQITGGADLSEQFKVKSADADSSPAPGLVVSIDPQSHGNLRISSRAYDRKVAGILSGAGGVNPGMLMSQQGTEVDGSSPVALTGRVYCRADASNGAIEPGDLLTTSDTPGHAMKVTDHTKAQGAVLGKAMTGLGEGRGLVLVLVTLQ
jgi:hypothetical protein